MRKNFRPIIFLLLMAILVTASGCQKTETVEDPVEGWAVLAEKDDYKDVEMTDMLTDYIDTIRMRQALEASGWNPDQIHEAREFDRESIQVELDWLEENADENDIVIIYVAAHGNYLSNVLNWNSFFPEEWSQILSKRQVLIIDVCRAGKFTKAVAGDAEPHLAIASTDVNEFGWRGLEEEGLPIIGTVFTYYFSAALSDPNADTDGDGKVSVQEAALMAEAQQRTYMQDVVLVVPEFLQSFHAIGAHPEEYADYPDVLIDDTLGEALFLTLE